MNQQESASPDFSAGGTWQSAVLDSRDYLVMALDTHGVILNISAGGLLQLGYKLDELRGKIAPAILFEPREITRRARRLSEELGENVEPGFKVFVFRAREGIPDEQEWNCVRRDGSHVPVRMTLHPQRDSSGEISGYVALARNVSDLFKTRKDLADRETQLKVAHARLAATTVTDELTGMKNRRAFNEHLEREFQRALRHHSVLSLVFANVDDIKGYNAEHGHHAGDELIKMVSEQILKDARSTDYVARFAGDEFAFILPQTGREGAMIKADRLRKSIEASQWPLRAVTVSVGVATMTEESPVVQDLTNSRTLISRARDALFEAKRTGANSCLHFREINKDGAGAGDAAEQA